MHSDFVDRLVAKASRNIDEALKKRDHIKFPLDAYENSILVSLKKQGKDEREIWNTIWEFEHRLMSKYPKTSVHYVGTIHKDLQAFTHKNPDKSHRVLDFYIESTDSFVDRLVNKASRHIEEALKKGKLVRFPLYAFEQSITDNFDPYRMSKEKLVSLGLLAKFLLRSSRPTENFYLKDSTPLDLKDKWSELENEASDLVIEFRNKLKRKFKGSRLEMVDKLNPSDFTKFSNPDYVNRTLVVPYKSIYKN